MKQLVQNKLSVRIILSCAIICLILSGTYQVFAKEEQEESGIGHPYVLCARILPIASVEQDGRIYVNEQPAYQLEIMDQIGLTSVNVRLNGEMIYEKYYEPQMPVEDPKKDPKEDEEKDSKEDEEKDPKEDEEKDPKEDEEESTKEDANEEEKPTDTSSEDTDSDKKVNERENQTEETDENRTEAEDETVEDDKGDEKDEETTEKEAGWPQKDAITIDTREGNVRYGNNRLEISVRNTEEKETILEEHFWFDDKRDTTSLYLEIPQEAVRVNGDHLYKEQVAVMLSATDELIGIDHIRWEVRDEAAVILSGETDISKENTDWQVLKNEQGLVTSLSTSIPVMTESNRIQMTAVVTNRLGRTQTAECVFGMDQTPPEIEFQNMRDASANRLQVAPEIVISDSHLLESSVRVEVSRLDQQEIVWDCKREIRPEKMTVAFPDLERTKENDGVYRMQVTAEDCVGNQTSKEITFSVNRFGSTYFFPSEILSIEGNYLKEPRDIFFTEINVDPIEENSLIFRITHDGQPSTMEGDMYQVHHEQGAGGWHRYTYTIGKEQFLQDGSYVVVATSTDLAGNRNSSQEEQLMGLRFGVDQTPPVVSALNLSDGQEIEEDEFLAHFLVQDNLVLSDVETWINHESISTTPSDSQLNIKLSVTEDPLDVKLVAKDAAGNETVCLVGGIVKKPQRFLGTELTRRLEPMQNALSAVIPEAITAASPWLLYLLLGCAAVGITVAIIVIKH